MADKSIGTAYVDLKTKVDKKSQNSAFKDFGNIADRLPSSIGGALGKATALGDVFSKYGTAIAGANSAAAGLATTMAAGAGSIGVVVGGMAATVGAANKALDENTQSWENLETKILTINGLVGGDQTAFDAFKTAIMEVASTTSWTAEQVADGMEALVRGGATAEQAIKSIGVVADFARAQVWDMGSSADLLSNVRNQFNLSIDDVTHIADVISTATASSAQNVSDFAEAMKMAGSTAGKMGQSLERTAAQIDALANVGIKGTMGGSAINALISRISGNKKAQKTLNELGVETHDQQGILRPLDEILTDARRSMQEKGWSNAQQETAWTQIAGAENLKSALTLSQNYLADIADTLRSVDGTTKAQAAAIDSGLKGSKEILASARDAITKQLGEAGAAGMKDRTDRITEAVGLAAEAAKDTAVSLERFSDASAAFGDIQGDLEILKQETLNALVSTAASIVEGLSPLIDLAHEILKILIDRDKLAAKQIVNVNNEAVQKGKEERRDIKWNAAKRTYFESTRGKALEQTTAEGVKLQGEEAYEYATNRRKALTAKQANGTKLTDDETKEIERLSDFINEADETIGKVAVNYYDKIDNLLKSGTDDELKQTAAANKRERDSYKGIIDQYKKRVEGGEFKESDPYGKAVLDAYSQAVKNYSKTAGRVEQIEAELALRDQRKRIEKEKPIEPTKPTSETVQGKPVAAPTPETIPLEDETKKKKKKGEEETPPPTYTPPTEKKEETPPQEIPPTAEKGNGENGVTPPAPELKIPDTILPAELEVKFKIDASEIMKPLAQGAPTFANTIAPVTNVPQEITDPAALNILKQINDALVDMKSKPATKVVNM